MTSLAQSTKEKFTSTKHGNVKDAQHTQEAMELSPATLTHAQLLQS